MGKEKTTVEAVVEGEWWTTDSISSGLIREFCGGVKDGKKIKITFQESRSSRTVEANNYYWGVVVKSFQREWPDLPQQEVHRVLGEEFRKFRRPETEIEKLKEICTANGNKWNEEYEWYIKGSSDMDVHQFWEYCERCTVQLFEIGGELRTIEEATYKKVKEMFKTEDVRIRK